MLILTIGVLGAGGAGALGPSVLMGAVARRIDPARRGMATGIVGAGGSFGQFAVIPLAQWMIGGLGWVQALWGLSLLTLLALPMILALRVPPGEAGATAAGGATLGEAVRGALRDPSFLLLSAGFFVCGFHVAFIATHLPGVVAACGLPPSVGAWALAVVGLFNIAGSFAIGWAVDRWRMKSLLSLIYATRAVAVLAFVLAPKTEAVVLVFAAVIGFTYLSTVPPTAGLVAKLHGARYMATLFGLVMLSHQVGGFLGAWLGGKAFEATGSYDWMWWIDIALAVGAALLHLPIREARVAPRAAAAAA
jgi:predicted MFS family arabinose efflux permease